MAFKSFLYWCNQRACDGCWGLNEAMICLYVISEIRKEPFWRREKVWKQYFKDSIVNEIVMPIEAKIKEVYEK